MALISDHELVIRQSSARSRCLVLLCYLNWGRMLRIRVSVPSTGEAMTKTLEKFVRLGMVFFVAQFGPQLVLAQVYKWIDERGVTQYSDSPPGDKRKQTVLLPDKAVALSGKLEAKGPRPSIQDQEIAFQRRRIEKEQTECAELARVIVDNNDRSAHMALIGKYNGMCRGRKFQCTTIRSNPGANKCVPAVVLDDNAIIQNTIR